ncbi:hypothetical protein HH310_12570 [Actinoplanes sp. TBRC 11911]|uniref:hypothetical protein n=1 Tax=Actinoplanes sp. TBRC 11911 TaxID=2729386 RepID=UPI00145E5624|nr:hypothetical protein [Actinoplanes sp. TBRC 11911]NMO52027.1 hypothetical protein [Actinoplanes sp. TBRC 11911]
MRSTETILKDLRKRAAAGEDVRQQIISQETIARLVAELATVDTDDVDRARGLIGQIGVHMRLVEEEPAFPEPALPERRPEAAAK